MFPTPRIPTLFDDDADRTRRIEAHIDTDSRRTIIIFAGGWVALLVFLLTWAIGFPGAGVILVPIGLLMIIGSGIELLVNRLG